MKVGLGVVGGGYPALTTFTDRNRHNILEWYVRSLSCTSQRSLARSESFARKIANCADSFWFVENSFSLFAVSMWWPNDEKCLVKTLDHFGPEPRLELFIFVCFSFYEGAWDRSTRSVKDFETCRCTWLNLMRCQLTLTSMLCIRGEQHDL